MGLTQSTEHFKIRNFSPKGKSHRFKAWKKFEMRERFHCGCETEGPRKRERRQLVGARSNPQMAGRKDPETYKHKELDFANLNELKS